MFGKGKSSGGTATNQAPPAEDINNEENLIKLHSALIEFYHKHKPENLDNDVLIILMQFYIDNGAEKFNRKLRDKYGEDLLTLTRGKPQQKNNNIERKVRERERNMKKTNNRGVSSTKMTASKNSHGVNANGPKLREDKHGKGRKGKMRRADSQFHRTLPPAPKDPNDKESVRSSLRIAKRRSDREISSTPINKQPKNRMKTDSDYSNSLKKTQPKNKKKINEYVDNALEPTDLDDLFAPDLDDGTIDLPEHKLSVLDNPKPLLKARDLIEAFYSKHDETKLDTYGLIEKFVDYAEQNNVKDLSRKLEKKYGQGLEDSSIQKLAIRRKNLEAILTEFYLQHDPSKIKTRWAVLKIVTWSMKRGLPRLNGKFQNRYGLPVVQC